MIDPEAERDRRRQLRAAPVPACGEPGTREHRDRVRWWLARHRGDRVPLHQLTAEEGVDVRTLRAVLDEAQAE